MLNSPYEAFYVKGSDIYSSRVDAHWHYFVEIMFLFEGSARVTCDNQEYHVVKGDLVFFHPGAIHAIFKPSKDLVYGIIKLNLSSLHTNQGQFVNPVAIIRSARGDSRAPVCITHQELNSLPVREWYERCIEELSTRKYGFDTCFYSTVSNLLIAIIRIWKQNGFPVEHITPAASEERTLQTITEYIDEHSNQPLRVEMLAKMCGMSYSYFARNFRLLYGRSCKDYIEFVRIRKVKDLLMYTELDLNYISQETGFSDCSHLIRVFKQFEGTTPKQFRITNTL